MSKTGTSHGPSGWFVTADLIELNMIEFDINISMDWLAAYYGNVDYRGKIVRFQFPGEPIIE